MKLRDTSTHPATHRAAVWHHGILAGIGVLHIIGGALMLWYHGVAAKNHWLNRDKDNA